MGQVKGPLAFTQRIITSNIIGRGYDGLKLLGFLAPVAEGKSFPDLSVRNSCVRNKRLFDGEIRALPKVLKAYMDG